MKLLTTLSALFRCIVALSQTSPTTKPSEACTTDIRMADYFAKNPDAKKLTQDFNLQLSQLISEWKGRI